MSKGPALKFGGRLALTVLAIAHLALVLVLPGGRNPIFGVDATARLPYLTFWRTGQAFGFPPHGGQDSYVRFDVYDQSGTTLEGVFPNPNIKPDLRYLRWAAAGQAVSGDRPELHSTLLDYLLRDLESPPLKIEMYAGAWVLEHQPCANGGGGKREAGQRKLGTHDGLTQAWKPEAEPSAK